MVPCSIPSASKFLKCSTLCSLSLSLLQSQLNLPPLLTDRLSIGLSSPRNQEQCTRDRCDSELQTHSDLSYEEPNKFGTNLGGFSSALRNRRVTMWARRTTKLERNPAVRSLFCALARSLRSMAFHSLQSEPRLYVNPLKFRSDFDVDVSCSRSRIAKNQGSEFEGCGCQLQAVNKVNPNITIWILSG